MQRMKRRRLHQPDHIRSRIHRRQLRMVRGQRMPELDRLFRLAPRSERNFYAFHVADSFRSSESLLPHRGDGFEAAARVRSMGRTQYTFTFWGPMWWSFSFLSRRLIWLLRFARETAREIPA